jgi:hypothetical protein
VLYGHFPDGRDGIVRAVAIDGLTELTRYGRLRPTHQRERIDLLDELFA